MKERSAVRRIIVTLMPSVPMKYWMVEGGDPGHFLDELEPGLARSNCP